MPEERQVIQKRKGKRTPASDVSEPSGRKLYLMTRPDGLPAEIPSDRYHELKDNKGFTDGHEGISLTPEGLARDSK